MISPERANFFQLTAAQLHALNARLPTGFFMDQNRAAKGAAPQVDLFPARNKRPPPIDAGEKIETLLTELKSHPKAAPFLGSSRSHMSIARLESRASEYTTVQEFTTDVRKMLNQGLQAYKQGSAEHEMVADLSSHFEKVMARGARSDRPLRVDAQPLKTRSDDAKTKTNGADEGKKAVKPMSFQEKQTLAEHIRQLDKRYLVKIIDIVSGHNRKGMKDQFEFDIDTLPPEVCWKLKEYVKKCRQEQTGESKKRRSESTSLSSSYSGSDCDSSAPRRSARTQRRGRN